MRRVGIVTDTYNSRSVLEDFFASLEKQTHTDHALYIVDSGSTTGPVARFILISCGELFAALLLWKINFNAQERHEITALLRHYINNCPKPARA